MKTDRTILVTLTEEEVSDLLIAHVYKTAIKGMELEPIYNVQYISASGQSTLGRIEVRITEGVYPKTNPEADEKV